MRQRVLAMVALALVTALAAGVLATSQSPVVASQPEGPALVQIRWRAAADLEAVDKAGVPVYARLAGAQGPSLLAGATAAAVAELRAQGLEVVVLDRDLASARKDGLGYYVVDYLPQGPAPGRSRPEWQRYGLVLLEDAQREPLADVQQEPLADVQREPLADVQREPLADVQREPLEDARQVLRMMPQQATRLAAAGAELQAVSLDPKPLYTPGADSLFPAAIEPDPRIQAMIDQVEQATVYDYTGGLSGEWPVLVGGQAYTIETRYSRSTTPIEKATQFAYEHLNALGLDVAYHSYSLPSTGTRRNVIAEIQGTTNPEEVYVLCGHLDSTSNDPYNDAPGADDNASGSVGVLVAADILSQYQWSCTLRLALWTGEEQGLHGSAAYAQEAYTAGENIAGVLNLDMIAWNTPGSSRDIDLHANATMPATMDLAQLYADVVTAYNLDLVPEIKPNGTSASDHASFWQYGYPAILAIEDMGDFNPRYHTTGDLLQYLDMDYYTELVKASLATFAHMSGCLVEGRGFLDGQVTSADGGAPIALAQVEFDAGGEMFNVQTNSSGYYTATLATGTYTVTAAAKGYLPETVSGVLVTSGTVATQDFVLQPAPVIVVVPPAVEAELVPGEVATPTLWVSNTGQADLVFGVEALGGLASIRPSVTLQGTGPAEAGLAWLSVAPTGGTVAPGEGIALAVTLNAAGQDPGTLSGLLDVASNDPAMPHVTVPVTLTVLYPVAIYLPVVVRGE